MINLHGRVSGVIERLSDWLQFCIMTLATVDPGLINPFMGLNICIHIISPIKGRGFITHGSGLPYNPGIYFHVPCSCPFHSPLLGVIWNQALNPKP